MRAGNWVNTSDGLVGDHISKKEIEIFSLQSNKKEKSWRDGRDEYSRHQLCKDMEEELRIFWYKTPTKLPISTTYVVSHITNMDTIFIKLYIVCVTLLGILENILVKYTFLPSSWLNETAKICYHYLFSLFLFSFDRKITHCERKWFKEYHGSLVNSTTTVVLQRLEENSCPVGGL